MIACNAVKVMTVLEITTNRPTGNEGVIVFKSGKRMHFFLREGMANVPIGTRSVRSVKIGNLACKIG
jgi:hypothetical protein